MLQTAAKYTKKTLPAFTGKDGQQVTLTGYNIEGGLWVTSSQEPEEFANNLAKYGIAPSSTGKGFVLNMGADLNAALNAGIKIFAQKNTTPVAVQMTAHAARLATLADLKLA